MGYTREVAEYLAGKLGTKIPLGIHSELWSLPILLKLVERIEVLELRLELLGHAEIDETKPFP